MFVQVGTVDSFNMMRQHLYILPCSMAGSLLVSSASASWRFANLFPRTRNAMAEEGITYCIIIDDQIQPGDSSICCVPNVGGKIDSE